MSDSRPKICFIGNCQAQALTSLAAFLDVNVNLVFLPPVFDLPAFGQRSVREDIDGCDVIFNQAVSEEFPIEYVRPSAIRDRIGGRAFSWPNIYFDGYFPGIRYIYVGANREKLTGPLSDYHFSIINSSWRDGASVTDCAQRIEATSEPYFSDNPVEKSLYALRQREAKLNIAISDYIAHYHRLEKLFFTMNHPSNLLLHEMLVRCCSRIDIKVPAVDAIAAYPYSLNKIKIPALPVFTSKYRPYFHEHFEFQGVELDMSGYNARQGTAPATYSLQQLIAAFYRLYDWHKDSAFVTMEHF